MRRDALRHSFRPEQVANAFNINIRTVYRLIRSKKLKATKMGRQWFITEKDIADYIVPGDGPYKSKLLHSVILRLRILNTE